MAAFSGAKVPTANLVFAIDAFNTRSPVSNTTNQLHTYIWSTGNSSVWSAPFYNLNGSLTENDRIYDTTPANTNDVVWQSPSNDATNDADGGWTSDKFSIDVTKKYRFSVWIRKKDLIGDGRAYLGSYGYNSNSSNIGIYRRTDGTTLNTNFYFMSPRFDNDMSPAPSVNEWVLFVGHIWPSGSAANTTPDPDTGVWRQNGTKIASGNDGIWNPNTTLSAHRSYQYYSTTTNEKQQWWQPRVDLINGSEPSLTQLLAGFSDDTFDVRGKVRTRARASLKTANSFTFSNTGNIINDRSEGIAVDGSNAVFTTEQTIIIALKPTDFSQRRTPYNQSYFGFGTITQEVNGEYVYFSGNGANTTTYTGYSSGATFLSNNETAVIAVTRNTSSITWFKNGSYINTATNAYPAANLYTNDTTLILLGYGYTSYGFIGDIYLTYVYNRALSNTEISQHFDAVRGRFNL